ncbi:MAG: beta-lactamase family protein [Deltaproteobacteria bacterium]|nr:beta-lactamase family protein [Deltaproteobacteria bacterium]
MKSRVSSLMHRALADGVFPAAELLVARGGVCVHHQHYGAASAMTIFDLASLTKSVVTATRCMQLCQTGRLDLEWPLQRLLGSQAAGSPSADVTVRQLLMHTAGCPAWRPFYVALPPHEVGTAVGRRAIERAALMEPPESVPGTVGRYSDVGFILLGMLLETIDARPLDVQFATEIAEPFGMTATTTFRPLSDTATAADTTHCAPTEDCPWRKQMVQGHVHDQNCYAMGGVAGHAGLFGNATDLDRFVRAIRAAWQGDSTWLDPTTVRTFFDRRRIENIPGAHYVCGWDTPSGDHPAAGHHTSPNTVGHLGFTGCSLWIDLDADWSVILLTNRIHPRVDNVKIQAFRPQLHDAIINNVLV